MRIIGGKDYYDSGLAYGRDESLVFVRLRHSTADPLKMYEVPLTCPKALAINSGRGPITSRAASRMFASESRDTMLPLYVWFAGKRYGAVLYESAPNYGFTARPAYDDGGTHSSRRQRWFWNCESFLSFLAEKKMSLREPTRWNKDSITTETIALHFSGNGSDAERDWLIENGVAIVIPNVGYQKQDGWFLNTDGLKDIDFVKALDPFTAFQELSMFVGGVMARPDRPTVEITDNKIIAAKHGFDEWSFRKPGGGR